MAQPSPTPSLVVLSGPSGCGKTTLRDLLLEDSRVEFSVSVTTRQPRPGEVDGSDYHFAQRAEFEAGIAAGLYLEHAEVHGEFYGTPRRSVAEALARGHWMLLDIDVQGASQLREGGVEGIYIMVVPPSLEVLQERLERRGTESLESLERRLRAAERELARRELYDHEVVNDHLERAHEEIRRLVGLSDAAPPVDRGPGSTRLDKR